MVEKRQFPPSSLSRRLSDARRCANSAISANRSETAAWADMNCAAANASGPSERRRSELPTDEQEYRAGNEDQCRYRPKVPQCETDEHCKNGGRKPS